MVQVAGLAVDQRRDLALFGSDDGIAFETAEIGSRIGFGGSFFDREGAGRNSPSSFIHSSGRVTSMSAASGTAGVG
jgi:hypothetical protein